MGTSENAVSDKAKDPSIETLRGIAILLVVAGYIVRTDINPLEIHDIWGSAFRSLEYMLSYLRLPLFTVISGYLYGAFPATRETLKKLILGKKRRILVPFATFTTIQYLFFSLTTTDYPLQNIFKAYIWPDQQLWFLVSICWIFLIVGTADAMKLLNTPKRYGIACLIAVALHVSFELPEALSITGVNFLLPFFLLGYGLRRYSGILLTKPFVRASLIIFPISFLLKPILYQFNHFLSFHEYRLLGLIVAGTGIPLMFYYRRPVPALAFFGYYAFGIHLFHRVAGQSTRLMFQSFNLQAPVLIFFIYMIGTVGIALLMQLVLERIPWAKVYVLGLKLSSKERPNPSFTREFESNINDLLKKEPALQKEAVLMKKFRAFFHGQMKGDSKGDAPSGEMKGMLGDYRMTREV